MYALGTLLAALTGPCVIGLVSQEAADHGYRLLSCLDTEKGLCLADDAEANLFPTYATSAIFDSVIPLRQAEPGNVLCPALAMQVSDDISLLSIPLGLPHDRPQWVLVLSKDHAALDDLDPGAVMLATALALRCSSSREDLRKLREANRWIEAELKDVARVKRLLLPQGNELANTPGIRYDAFYHPHGHVGGDYYDIADLSPILAERGEADYGSVWGFMIADASGHGSASAVEIAMFDAILRTYLPQREKGPACVFDYVNRHSFTRKLRGGFITAFVCSYHANSRTLSYSVAGHPPPLVNRNGRILTLDEGAGLPLGVIADAHWTSASITLQAGDTLMLYTDGITEARAPDGKFFGEARLQALLSDHPEPIELVKAIKAALEDHQQGTAATDDQTLLAIRIDH